MRGFHVVFLVSVGFVAVHPRSGRAMFRATSTHLERFAIAVAHGELDVHAVRLAHAFHVHLNRATKAGIWLMKSYISRNDDCVTGTYGAREHAAGGYTLTRIVSVVRLNVASDEGFQFAVLECYATNLVGYCPLRR